MALTVEQCRAARILLGWSALDLADVANLGIATVKRFESGQTVAANSIAQMATALRDGGIVLLAPGEASTSGGAGVRLAGDQP